MQVPIPPSSHFIYIPIVLVLGIVLGFIMGSRATRDAIRIEQQKSEERARKKAERHKGLEKPDDGRDR